MFLRKAVLTVCLALLAGCAYGPHPGSLQSQERTIGELERKIQDHERRLDLIRADLDQTRTSLDLLRQETAQRIMDLELNLEPVGDVAGPPPDTLQPESGKQVRTETVPALQDSLRQPQPRGTPEPAPAPVLQGRSDYDRALEMYFAEDAEGARQGFRDFMERYPDSPLLPNAWYWLAETYYMEKDYPRAILTFRQVLDRFPEDPKAPDALLKIGYSYERLGDLRNALFYLDVLTRDYPGSGSAARAADRSREIRQRQ
ncbi:tol-pal system protein YbgF [Desulfonatronovibrio hydrogenovorans]|uniref:tol-pal system protein YbgF n=1 Tax=Desulfonatronovibrio hydrogenovorans TaxID=53245 RepID=UPI00068DDBD7|nr:tol-pal system protein YbgF [Desulfonatronovibrio hydrogenovorans]